MLIFMIIEIVFIFSGMILILKNCPQTCLNDVLFPIKITIPNNL